MHASFFQLINKPKQKKETLSEEEQLEQSVRNMN